MIEKRDIIGWILIAVGLVILGISFILAYSLYNAYDYEWFIEVISAEELLKAVTNVLPALIFIVYKVVAIAIMVWIGSIITARGIDILRKS